MTEFFHYNDAGELRPKDSIVMNDDGSVTLSKDFWTAFSEYIADINGEDGFEDFCPIDLAEMFGLEDCIPEL